MKKNILLLLLALIVAPAWAADTAPAPSSGDQSAQTAQPAQKHEGKKHKAKKHKAKKTKKKTEAAGPASTMSTTTTCYKLTCGGVLGCFKRACTGSCSPC